MTINQNNINKKSNKIRKIKSDNFNKKLRRAFKGICRSPYFFPQICSFPGPLLGSNSKLAFDFLCHPSFDDS